MPSKFLTLTVLRAAVALSLVAMPLLALRNGMMDHRAGFNAKGAYLPNSKIPIQVAKTGITQLDEYLALMSAVFHVDLDVRNVAAHTQGTHFLGTLSAAWILMLVEAHRVGASTGFMLFTYVAEVIGELIGVGTMTPVWAIYHIASLARNSSGTARRQSLSLSKRDSFVLPLAFLAGHVLPTLAMIKLNPADTGIWSQQTWVLLRLIHPFMSMAIWVALRLFAPRTQATVSPKGWYIWAIVAGTLMHVTSLTPLLLLDLSPDWVAPHVAKQLDVKEIFLPVPFWLVDQPKITSFVQGVSHFLKWDEFFCSLSIIVWAGYMYGQSRAELKVPGGSLLVWAQTALLVALGGPGAAAAFLMLQREELESAAQIEPLKKLN